MGFVLRYANLRMSFNGTQRTLLMDTMTCESSRSMIQPLKRKAPGLGMCSSRMVETRCNWPSIRPNGFQLRKTLRSRSHRLRKIPLQSCITNASWESSGGAREASESMQASWAKDLLRSMQKQKLSQAWYLALFPSRSFRKGGRVAVHRHGVYGIYGVCLDGS